MDQPEKYVRVFERKKVTIDKELGSGSFGRVCRATIAGANLPPIAVKIFYPELQKSQTIRKAYDELNKVGSLEHDNIVKLIGLVEDDIPWLVFEYLKDGNLLDYVFTKKNVKERKLVKYCRDISRGMAYLHRNRILHKDLAARNILLDNKIAKIADLGLSSILGEEEHGVTYSVVGKMLAFRHAASECVVEGFYAYESDVWSMGILMWEIWTGGAVPYGEELREAEVRRIIAEGGNPMQFQAPNCSSNINSLLEYILQVPREERPTFHELRMIFEHLLEGGKFRRGPKEQFHNPLTRERSDSTNTRSTSPRRPPRAVSPFRSDQILNSQNPNFSSTPNLLISSTPPKGLNIVQKEHRQRPPFAKTGSGDLLEPPTDYHQRLGRRGSDYNGSSEKLETKSGLSSSLKNESLFPPQLSQKHLFSSANNLHQHKDSMNGRHGKSQSDLREEILKDLIQNRFQRKV